jgi:hypothetical protein
MIEPLLLVVGGIALIGYAIHLFSRASAMQKWSAADGEILQSRVVEERDRTDDVHVTLYRAEMMYGYRVGNSELAGYRRSLADGAASTRAYAESIVTRYPVGRHVTVYFDPTNPRDSVLELISAPVWARLIFALGLIAGLSGAVWLWRT